MSRASSGQAKAAFEVFAQIKAGKTPPAETLVPFGSTSTDDLQTHMSA